MPSDGVDLSPASDILTDDEIIRLSTLFVKSGVTKIRLTGGEPTIRKGVLDIVGMASDGVIPITDLLTPRSPVEPTATLWPQIDCHYQ
jgi:molybdenum cofactor biosynthesis enzyme MoaA